MLDQYLFIIFSTLISGYYVGEVMATDEDQLASNNQFTYATSKSLFTTDLTPAKMISFCLSIILFLLNTGVLNFVSYV